MGRGASPITNNPLQEKDLVDNKGLQMAIDAALKMALKEQDYKALMKKTKSERIISRTRRMKMPNKLSKSMMAGVGMVANEFKVGVGVLNELNEKVLGPPIFKSENNIAIADNEVEELFEAEREVQPSVDDILRRNGDDDDDNEQKQPQPGSQRSRRRNQRTDNYSHIASMTTGNSGLDARIAAFQQSEAIDLSCRSSNVGSDSEKSVNDKPPSRSQSQASQQPAVVDEKAAYRRTSTELRVADSAFNERLRRKMSEGSSNTPMYNPVSHKAGKDLDEFETKLQRKLAGKDSSSPSRVVTSDGYESKLQRKLARANNGSRDVIDGSSRSGYSIGSGTSSRDITAEQALDSYESKLQRKLAQSIGSGTSSRDIAAEQALDSYESKLQRKLAQSAGRSSSARNVEPEQSYESKLQRKLSKSVGDNSSARSVAASTAEESYESKLQRKLSERTNSARSTASANKSLRSIEDHEARVQRKLAKSGGDESSAQDNYEKRLQRKLSQGSLSVSSTESFRRLDSFEERIAAKCNDAGVSSRHTSVDSFEEQIAAKAKGESVKEDPPPRGEEVRKDRKKSRRDLLDQKLKDSIKIKKEDLSKSADADLDRKNSSKDETEDDKKRRRRARKREKAEQVRASLTSSKETKTDDNSVSRDPPELERSCRGRLSIVEDEEGISEILEDGTIYRMDSDPAALRHLSSLTIEGNSDHSLRQGSQKNDHDDITDVGWGDLDVALIAAQQMSMRMAPGDAAKIQSEVDTGWDDNELKLAQQMSLRMAPTDASKIQSELESGTDDDLRGDEGQRGLAVAERKSRGRRGEEDKHHKHKMKKDKEESKKKDKKHPKKKTREKEKSTAHVSA